MIRSSFLRLKSDLKLSHYTFTYRITRMSDVRVGLRSVLDEAMRRSGARTELEAIVAGPRSLRAPIPRKIEPETGNLPSSAER